MGSSTGKGVGGPPGPPFGSMAGAGGVVSTGEGIGSSAGELDGSAGAVVGNGVGYPLDLVWVRPQKLP